MQYNGHTTSAAYYYDHIDNIQNGLHTHLNMFILVPDTFQPK